MTKDGALVQLPTGVTLNVVEEGPDDGPPVILLHGFPESHRTWRSVAPRLTDRYRCIMPDQRGFGASDRPQDVADYSQAILIKDIFALADALDIERFALVGHDWGGAIAWPAALAHPDRLTSLCIVNAPHPWIFQRTLIDDPAQRAASQYINAFRTTEIEAMIEQRGIDWLFDRSFAAHVDLGRIEADERARYIDDWSRPGALTAMFNWYRASGLKVPAPGERIDDPPWMANFPRVTVPTLVVWGLRDSALLPIQLDGLANWVDDLTIERIPGAGHFAPWEAPDAVADALLNFFAKLPR